MSASWVFLHRVLLQHVRSLLDALPPNERGTLCRELSTALMAMARELSSPSGLMAAQVLPTPDDVSGNGDKDGE